jgi:hypothetical protein
VLTLNCVVGRARPGLPVRSSPKIDESAQTGSVPTGGAERDLVGLGALEVEMRRVFPGHPDAAMELYGLLSRPHGEITVVCLRDRRR